VQGMGIGGELRVAALADARAQRVRYSGFKEGRARHPARGPVQGMGIGGELRVAALADAQAQRVRYSGFKEARSWNNSSSNSLRPSRRGSPIS